MAQKGPRRKPVELRVIEGNPSKRPLPKGTPKPPPERPYAPRWLSAEAKTEWDYIVPKLDSQGLLTKVDRATLAAYCEAVATFVDATEWVREKGLIVAGQRKGDAKKNPAVQIARDASHEIARYSRMFGFSPADRAAMEGVGGLTGGAGEALARVLSGAG